MRWLSNVAVLAGLTGCASVAPLDEAERARVRIVAPVAGPSALQVDFALPPGRADGASSGAAGGLYASLGACAAQGRLMPACLALMAPVAAVGGGVAGAVMTPSAGGLEPLVERARGHLGASDVQQGLVQRFSEHAKRLTPHAIDSIADRRGEGVLVAELAVTSVGATLASVEIFGPDYASRPLQVRLAGRMRLVRAADGATVMSRDYLVGRYARRVQEYQEDGTALLRVVAGAVDEMATLMVDDAFLLRADMAGTAGTGPSVTPLAPVPAGVCMSVSFDCWALTRVSTLDTLSPVFRWKPFAEPRDARNVVYDLWIFGGDDDRRVEGLTATEHTLERPLAACMRYSWAVRARFDTGAGWRAVEWSTTAAFHRSTFGADLRPTFGAPFITPCPGATATQ